MAAAVSLKLSWFDNEASVRTSQRAIWRTIFRKIHIELRMLEILNLDKTATSQIVPWHDDHGFSSFVFGLSSVRSAAECRRIISSWTFQKCFVSSNCCTKAMLSILWHYLGPFSTCKTQNIRHNTRLDDFQT
jgi:hypothetical protein